jgi:hypothetical protein
MMRLPVSFEVYFRAKYALPSAIAGCLLTSYSKSLQMRITSGTGAAFCTAVAVARCSIVLAHLGSQRTTFTPRLDVLIFAFIYLESVKEAA